MGKIVSQSFYSRSSTPVQSLKLLDIVKSEERNASGNEETQTEAHGTGICVRIKTDPRVKRCLPRCPFRHFTAIMTGPLEVKLRTLMAVSSSGQ
jgi:hypothetical protein